MPQVTLPKEIKSDNGPPFNGKRFEELCDYFGIKHRKITPYHPPANGSAESFMKNMSKVIRNAIVERKDWRQTLNQFLRSYRSTPHSTTGIPPAVLMFGENRTDRLPTIRENKITFETSVDIARKNDNTSKEKSKIYADKRRKANEHVLKCGDSVFMEQKRVNKWMTRFSEEELRVVEVNGSMITVENGFGKRFSRNASVFKQKNVRQPESSKNLSDTSLISNQNNHNSTAVGQHRRKLSRVRKQTVLYDSHKPETWQSTREMLHLRLT